VLSIILGLYLLKFSSTSSGGSILPIISDLNMSLELTRVSFY